MIFFTHVTILQCTVEIIHVRVEDSGEITLDGGQSGYAHDCIIHLRHCLLSREFAPAKLLDVFSRSLTTIALLAASAMLQAAIVDRIAIVVGDKIITESEIDLRIRLSAFQNEQKTDFSLAARQLAARELVDQRLVEHEMDVGHYPRLEGAARKALVGEYAKANYKDDTAAMDKALADYGLTALDLEDDLGRQSDLLTFLNLRLRPVVAGVEQDPKVAEERTQKELDRWLQDQHTRTRIQYLDKDLEKGLEKELEGK